MLPIRFAVLSIAAALATGCAGRNFVRPTPDAFALGRTTQAQIVEQLGEPLGQGTVAKNGATVSAIRYAYAATGGEPLEDGVIPARSLVFFFSKDVLVGEEFVSSFKSDHSNFDDTKVPSIVKGATTRAQVVQLLGPPTCRYLPPMVKATSGEAIGYAYGTTRGSAFSGFQRSQKAALISFDERDRVSDVEFTAATGK